ncbi:SpoIIE family protein phosphatase [Geobacter sp. SVR]|uniref:SpoIIE family protein phosphatase n=1 Tax=Geobacter sp. SVR TaxID=2495594 RepID=UPI00143F03A7|nr:SpoIIE family protein phosphatase [Geobacter sp. SVR]BCS52305.1 hypothetical protein GSVR_06130 [Geobacter sp. SVR]GCF85036.1 hypothetical protein GSbR_16360 [Geobacter sp. SVR]
MRIRRLKTKFIIIVVAVSVAVGIATLTAFYTSTSGIIAEFARRFAVKEALLEKNRIISVIDREVVLAQKMADDAALKEWALAEHDPVKKGRAFTELESYRTLFRDRSCFIALASSGNYYINTRGADRQGQPLMTLDPAKPDDKWFYDGLRMIDSYALNLDYNTTLRETRVWLNAVMKDKNGKKIGLCGGGITLTDFLDEIVHTKEKGLAAILIDRSGVIQAHQDRSIVERNATERDSTKKTTIFSLMADPSQQELLRSALASLAAGKSEVEAFPARLAGRNHLVAVSFMPGVGWFNVVLVDTASVMSVREFLPIIAIMLISLLLVIVTIAILMNRMVLTPLTRLTDASRAVADGRYDVTLEVVKEDEIGELTGTFNAMTRTILDYTNNLEVMVRERTEELAAANRMLEASQQRITESIRYARMIQSSILPDSRLLEDCLGRHFILFRPKEMVGGDFYYLRTFPDHFLTAVIDCTGHGVPGAFMTMTVNAVLNHVVDMICSDDPARILAELHRVLRKTLNLRQVDVGLDIALCLVDRQGGRLVFAGAGLSLYIVSRGEIREVKGDHRRVGYRSSRSDFAYTNHELLVSAGDSCYLCSDGLLDQAGGRKGFGFGSDRFRTMLGAYGQADMQAQAAIFERLLNDYRGEYPQRDDMTLIGFQY